MVCVYCGHDTSVTNSRHQKRLNRVWRRRSCSNCGSIFTSIESLGLDSSIVVNNKGQLQPLQRDKLFLSIHDSLKHRKTALADSTSLTDTVVSQCMAHIDNGTISAPKMAQVTLGILKKFDKAAATHYEAFHPL